MCSHSQHNFAAILAALEDCIGLDRLGVAVQLADGLPQPYQPREGNDCIEIAFCHNRFRKLTGIHKRRADRDTARTRKRHALLLDLVNDLMPDMRLSLYLDDMH